MGRSVNVDDSHRSETSEVHERTWQAQLELALAQKEAAERKLLKEARWRQHSSRSLAAVLVWVAGPWLDAHLSLFHAD